mmetsp:Transcript_8552/g.14741  ORF Transcript_8552/g.14741 Transcript_8552/m.14741 type:complete len:398 (-) Transcript_8552:969-2162(-)
MLKDELLHTLPPRVVVPASFHLLACPLAHAGDGPHGAALAEGVVLDELHGEGGAVLRRRAVVLRCHRRAVQRVKARQPPQHQALVRLVVADLVVAQVEDVQLRRVLFQHVDVLEAVYLVVVELEVHKLVEAAEALDAPDGVVAQLQALQLLQVGHALHLGDIVEGGHQHLQVHQRGQRLQPPQAVAVQVEVGDGLEVDLVGLLEHQLLRHHVHPRPRLHHRRHVHRLEVRFLPRIDRCPGPPPKAHDLPGGGVRLRGGPFQRPLLRSLLRGLAFGALLCHDDEVRHDRARYGPNVKLQLLQLGHRARVRQRDLHLRRDEHVGGQRLDLILELHQVLGQHQRVVEHIPQPLLGVRRLHPEDGVVLGVHLGQDADGLPLGPAGRQVGPALGVLHRALRL